MSFEKNFLCSYACKFFDFLDKMKTYKINLEKTMNKRISTVVVAGGILTNVMGGVVATAYEGPTIYETNSRQGFIITKIDIRKNDMGFVFQHSEYPQGILKGYDVADGEISDGELETINFMNSHKFRSYLVDSINVPGWKDIASNKEVLPLGMNDRLAANTAGTFAVAYLVQPLTEVETTEILRERVDYSRCLNSEEYQNNDTALCRAEIWEDGKIHYQPYVNWERLAMSDENTEVDREIAIFKKNAWVSVTLEGTGRGGEPVGGEPSGGDIGNSAGGSEPSGGTGVEPEIRYVEKEVIKEVIKEVPVEKEVIKEVPVEKEVIKEVEVPVEKEVVKEVVVEKEVPIIKEVVKEVPVEKEIVSEAMAISEPSGAELTEATLSEGGDEELGNINDSTEKDEKNDEDGVQDEKIEESQAAVTEEPEIEPPVLGKESPQNSAEVSSKIAMVVAGMIAALALTTLALVYRKGKQRD